MKEKETNNLECEKKNYSKLQILTCNFYQEKCKQTEGVRKIYGEKNAGNFITIENWKERRNTSTNEGVTDIYRHNLVAYQK